MRPKTKPAPAELDGNADPVERARREFFARNPGEAKRQRREDARDAKWSRVQRRIDGYGAQARFERAAEAPLPRTKPAKRRGQVTSFRRGFAAIVTDPQFAEYGFGLVHATAPSARALPWPTDPTAPGFWEKNAACTAALVAAQRPLQLVEHVRFAATLFDGAEAFYREVRSAYRVRGELEQDIAAWPAWTNDDEIEVARASLRYEIDGSLKPESHEAAARLKRLVAELPPPPRRLHQAWNAAKLRDAGTYLRQVPRERGTGASAGREWPRFVRLEVLIGGHRKFYLPELAGRPGRVVAVDLLSPRLLGFLYGPARRTGPKAAALEFVAEVMDRSPAQVEKLRSSARAADAPK